MPDPGVFSEALNARWPFLQNMEEGLANRQPVLCVDLSEVGSTITTPLSLQHVGEQVLEIARSDWMRTGGLDTVVAYLGELAELWETMFRRHREATAVFAASPQRPYCLFLRSFKTVTHPIDVPGARATLFINEPELDANFAATLMEQAAWLNPVCCMHTDDMQLLVRTGRDIPAFRVQTVSWQGLLADAIASSGSVILYVDGDSPGVNFEIEQIRGHRLTAHTVVVYRGDKPPRFAAGVKYAAVMPVAEFLATQSVKTGPARLSKPAEEVLRRLTSAAKTRTAPTSRLVGMPCVVVDSGLPDGCGQMDPAASYFVTASNADAFVNYVEYVPDSVVRWNAMSQDIRLRGIQPDLTSYTALYTSLRMAFVAATCLGFTSSIAFTVGLLAKVTSMAKPDHAENRARVERYLHILDIAQRFNALTSERKWADKIEAFRESILEDPFM